LIFGKKRGSVIFGFPTPFPLVLVGYSVFAVELVPYPGVYERLTAEYLFVIPGAILILVAVGAVELLKVLTLKVIDGLTAKVF